MADEEGVQVQITATVWLPLSGDPGAGLWIIADGAETACPADWTKESADNLRETGVRVVATTRNPNRPIVTGIATQGVPA